MTDLTDEQLGRQWCERHGRRPKIYSDGRAKWLSPYWVGVFEFGNNADWLSPVVSMVVRDDEPDGEFSDESSAYAAVGSALRRIRGHVEFPT